MKKIILLFAAFLITASVFAQVADSAKRHVVLQGAANFRDLGGYETKDGHHVKWGELYRSADISKLTPEDLVILKNKKITYDVDLRGIQESAQAPDKFNPGTDYILCPAGSNNMGSMFKGMAAVKGEKGGDSLIMAYYSNIDSLALRYRPFFDKLLDVPTDQALVFHCTAGKDRTGIAAALMLYTLGVPYETIIRDYEATNYYRRAENNKATSQMAKYHIDEQVAKSMMAAKKEYLDTTFNEIKKQYGSIDIYLRDQIGLDNEKIAILKKKFLE